MLSGIRFVNKKKTSEGVLHKSTLKDALSERRQMEKSLMDGAVEFNEFEIDSASPQSPIISSSSSSDLQQLTDGVLAVASVDIPNSTRNDFSANVAAAKLLRNKLKTAHVVETSGKVEYEGQREYDVVKMKNFQAKQRSERLHEKMKSNSDSMCLSELVAAEKLGRIYSEDKKKLSEYDEAFAAELIKKAKPGTAQNSDSDDDNMGTSGKPKKRKVENSASDRQKIIRQGGSRVCQTCSLRSISNRNDQDIFVKSKNWILSLKPAQSRLSSLHLQLVPLDHICSSVSCEDEAISELLQIKRRLAVICGQINMIPLFLETAVKLESSPHCIIDVIPVTEDQLSEAVASFRMAIQTYGEIDHADKKRIFYLSSQKPLRSVVPRHLPYTAMEWLVEIHVSKDQRATGIVHVFETSMSLSQFGSSEADFAIDVVGSSLFEADPQNIRIRAQVDHAVTSDEEISKFRLLWKSKEET